MTTIDTPQTGSPIDPDAQAADRRRWWTLAALCISLMVVTIDNTILSVAIPTLIKKLGASNSEIQWIVDSYTIVFAGLLLTSGAIGDRFGRKRVLTIGIVLFGIGSAASALQTTATGLILTRGFMGIGGALIMPSTLSILTNVFRHPAERARAIGIWAGFSSVGLIVGPIAGGVLLAHFSWGSVFWVNIPIGVIALVAGYFLIPESKNPVEGALDPLGALLSIVGLVSLLFAIIEAPGKGWGSQEVLGASALAVTVLGTFIWWELRAEHPMLPLHFYRNRRFSAANGAITLTFFAMLGSMFLLTQFWQLVKGYTPLEVGYRLIPYALSMMFTAPRVAKIVEKFGTKAVMVTGLCTITTAMIGLSFLDPTSSYPRAIANLMLLGVGIALSTVPATESIMGSLPPEKAGVGSAVNDTTRQVGAALGVAVIGSVVAARYTTVLTKSAAAAQLTAAQTAKAVSSLGNALGVAPDLGARATAFVASAREAFMQAFASGVRIGAIVVFAAAVVAFKYVPARATHTSAVHASHEPTPYDDADPSSR